MGCARLPQAYEALKPLIARLYAEGELTLFARDGVAVFSYRIDANEAEINRRRCEALMASVVKLARHGLGREEPVLGVTFQHGRPTDISEHLRIFQGPITFG